MSKQNKEIYMIAGPNGSGKTTTARFLIPKFKIYEFINADEIARGLAPYHPESVALKASKLMVLRLRELLEANKSFVFETTGAGKNYIKHLQQAQEKGYQINLMYLWLTNDNLAVKRVSQRVAQGGHNIPENDIRKRYRQGIKHVLKYYLPFAHNALFLDNSDIDLRKVIASKNVNEDIKIEDSETWQIMQRLSYE